jgi:hypothetical protein
VAEIHICVRCGGDGFPSADELSTRYALEDAIVEANVGEIVTAGAGAGVMDVFLTVRDEHAALSAVHAIVERLNLAARTTVSVLEREPAS